MQNFPLLRPLPLQMTPCSSWLMFWAAAEQTVTEKRGVTRPLFRGGENISHPRGEELQSGYHRVSAICDTHLCSIIFYLSTIDDKRTISVPSCSNSWSSNRCVLISFWCFIQIPLSLERTNCHQCTHTYYPIVVSLLLVAGGLFSVCSIT